MLKVTLKAALRAPRHRGFVTKTTHKTNPVHPDGLV